MRLTFPSQGEGCYLNVSVMLRMSYSKILMLYLLRNVELSFDNSPEVPARPYITTA